MTRPESPTSARNVAAMGDLVAELAPLRGMYREATPGAIKAMAKTCWILEYVGATHFGPPGTPRPDVLAYSLVKQATARGWSWLQLQSYLARLKSERIRRA